MPIDLDPDQVFAAARRAGKTRSLHELVKAQVWPKLWWWQRLRLRWLEWRLGKW